MTISGVVGDLHLRPLVMIPIQIYCRVRWSDGWAAIPCTCIYVSKIYIIEVLYVSILYYFQNIYIYIVHIKKLNNKYIYRYAYTVCQ